MQTIFDYIKSYSNYTFKEEPFNEIDSVIFTDLSYINWDGILHDSNEYIYLKSAAIDYYNRYSDEDRKKLGMGMQAADEILKLIKDSKRYKYLKLYNHHYVGNSYLQFCALMIDIDDEKTFISIEGTDDLVSGWKEDFEISYKFPVYSQIECIKYLNSHIKLFDKKKYIIAGHSKGGNLALVGGMYMNRLKYKHIYKIISYDGPGLRNKEFNSIRYKRVQDKFIKVIPDYSLIGLLMNNSNNYIIYKSKSKGIMAHNTINWLVDDKKFIRCNELSLYSKELDKTITKWIKSYTYDERKKFIQDFFDIFKRAGIDNLQTINKFNLNATITLIKETNNLTKTSKDMLIKLFNILFTFIKDDIEKYIEHNIVNKK